MSLPSSLPRRLLGRLPKPTHPSTRRPHTSAFNTTAHQHDAPRPRLSPEKVAEKVRSIERKRADRAVRSLGEQAKRAEQRATKLEREVEVREKALMAEQLTTDLPELTDDQLESIYAGLMLATPQQLAQQFEPIAGPSSAALPSPDAAGGSLAPSRASLGREAVWDALEARLDRWQEEGEEGEYEMEGEELEEFNVQVESALAEKLRSRREGKQPERAPAKELLALQPSDSRAARLLNRLIDLSPEEDLIEVVQTKVDFEGGDEVVKEVESLEVAENDELPPLSLARGIAVREEWRTLLLACAESGDNATVLRGLSAMQRSIAARDASLVTELIAVYADQGRSKDAIELSIHANKAGIPLSVLSHHHLLASLVPANPGLALSHLQSLEAAGHTPLQETYTLIIRHLLSPKSPAAYVERGWDLFAHSRLVAHPIPSADMFSAMIGACARPGSSASPERAFDLFTEMVDDNGLAPTAEAYNGLIRACAREGSQKWYFEGVKMLRRMLRENVRPNRQTFHAVLEGAVGQGDLPRARWILVKMVDVGGEAAPNASTLGLVLRAYAEYEVPVKQHRIVSKWAAAQATREPATERPVQAASAPATSVENDTTQLEETSQPSTQQRESNSLILDLLGDSPLNYPGPLPTTSEELLAEATNLLHNALPVLSPSSPSSAGSRAASNANFADVVPTAFLLDSFLRVLCAHAPLEDAAHFYATAYDQCSIGKTGWTFDAIMGRCGTAKNRDKGEELARAVFDEWEAWTQEGAVSAEEVQGEAAEGIEAQERKDDGKTGKNVSRMWTGLMHVLARNFHDQEAVELLQTFIARYPPNRSPLPSARPEQPLPRLTSPLHLSNPLYAETVGARLLRPYILFEHLKLLHLRLVSVADKKGIAIVKGICMAYEGALKGLVRKQSSGMNKAEARKREKREQRRAKKEKRAADGRRG